MAHTNGARLTRVYTDTERQAILKAHLVDGLAIAEAERRAMAGTLVAGMGPFGRRRFGYSIIKQGRESFEATNDVALDSGTAGELKRLHRLALARTRELDDTSDVAEIARRAKALAETHRALRGAPSNTTRAKPKASASEQQAETVPQSAADTLAQLIKLANTAPSPTADANTGDNAAGEARGPVPSHAA